MCTQDTGSPLYITIWLLGSPVAYL